MSKLTNFLRLSLFAMVSCSVEPSGPAVFDLDYLAHIYPDNFVATVDNPFLPFTPGSTFTYLGETPDGIERTEVEVLSDTRVVMGIVCTVVWDRVFLKDKLVEETFDWYAQDKDGNVWYFGEDVDNYIDGVVDNHYGSWEAGIDGAEPGIVMLGNPVIALKYRQEHYIGQAEDHGEVIAKDATLTVVAGSFDNCLKIEETNPLDPSFLEYKYYARDVGLIRVDKIDVPVETEELQSFSVK